MFMCLQTVVEFRCKVHVDLKYKACFVPFLPSSPPSGSDQWDHCVKCTQRKSHALVHGYLPSLTEASRFMTVNILLGLALPMLMHSQTIVGSGAKYTSKVQLYTIKYIYQPPVKVPNELTVLNTQTQEVTCWNQLLSDEQLMIIHYCNEPSHMLSSAMTLTVTWQDELFTCSTLNHSCTV